MKNTNLDKIYDLLRGAVEKYALIEPGIGFMLPISTIPEDIILKIVGYLIIEDNLDLNFIYENEEKDEIAKSLIKAIENEKSQSYFFNLIKNCSIKYYKNSIKEILEDVLSDYDNEMEMKGIVTRISFNDNGESYITRSF